MVPERGQEPSRLPPSSASAGETPEPAAAFRDVLEQILTNTEFEQTQEESASPVRRDLLAVARELAEEPFSRSPVVEALVGVVTSRMQLLSPRQAITVRQTVARTLYDDVAMRLRLERFWDHLRRLASDDQ